MRRVVLGGLAWQGAATLLVRGVRYVAILVLGGLLSPGDFGLFASLYVFVEGLFLLQGVGLGEALVVRRERVEEAADAAFLLSAGAGLVLFGVAWTAAPAVAAFSGAPDAAGQFRVLAAALVVNSLRVVPMRLFERELAFRRKMLPTALGAVAYLVVSVLLAARGGAVWSFVGGVLAASAVETVAFWLVTPWRPRWRADRDVARGLIGFGVPVMLGGALTYLFATVDRLALVRWGGPEALGPYAFAFALAAQPAALGAMIVGTVMLPSYGALAADPERRLRLHRKAASATAGAGALFGVLAVVLAADVLRAAYGAKWETAIPVVRLLAAGAIFRSLVSLVGDFLVGIGRPRTYQTMNAVQLALLLAGLPLALARGGAAGVALLVGASALVALAYGWTAAARVLAVPVARLASALGTPAGAAAAALAALVAVRAAQAEPGSAPSLVAAAGASVLAFAAAWWLLDADLRRDARRLRDRAGAS